MLKLKTIMQRVVINLINNITVIKEKINTKMNAKSRFITLTSALTFITSTSPTSQSQFI